MSEQNIIRALDDIDSRLSDVAKQLKRIADALEQMQEIQEKGGDALRGIERSVGR